MVKNVVVSTLPAMPRCRRGLVGVADLINRVARMDMCNDMESNGELMVQEAVLRSAPAGHKLVVFDVGANIGDWTSRLLARAQSLGRDVLVHAFEPCSGTYQMLQETLRRVNAGEKVVAVNKALSEAPGEDLLRVVGDGVGSNSLHVGAHAYDRTETIVKIDLDAYCLDNGIAHIHFLKSDVEGHDWSVMKGASKMLERGGIDVIQFEYNHRWIYSRHYLYDVFNLLQPWGYWIGKITPKAVEFYEAWEPELESFREGNYIACRPQCVNHFSRITWWKTA